MTSRERTLAIGVDLGATTVKTGLVASDGSIVYQVKLPAQAMDGPRAVMKQVELSIRDVMKHADDLPLVGIGIGSPGVVDHAGVVKSPPNFKDWDAVSLADEMAARFESLPIRIENDANAAAIAELKFGAGKEIPDFLFVIWGTGVGGGIILDRQIYRGPTGGAGEIGHISIDYDGPICNCGSRGCVEAFVGQRYLSQRTAERLKKNPHSKILQLVDGNPEKIEPYYISQAAHDGDELAIEILTEAGELLGVAIGAVMNTFDLRVSVLGGGVSAAGNFVLDAITHSIQAHVLNHLRPDIRVLQAKLGNNAGILGAAGLVM
jgi:glucokinase